MKQLDLSTIVGESIRVLIGQERGVAVRNSFKLDELDVQQDPVEIIVPRTLRTLTPSFVQGLFASSVKRLGEEQFFAHYHFDAEDHMVGDIRAGIDRVLTSRHLAG